MTNTTKYPWIESTGQSWKYHFGGHVGIFGFLGFLVAAGFGVAAFFKPPLGFVSLGIIALYFVGGLLEIYIMYYMIKCSKCGHNPTRRKDGKWASPRYLEGKFKKMAKCPECKDGELIQQPDAEVQSEGAPSD